MQVGICNILLPSMLWYLSPLKTMNTYYLYIILEHFIPVNIFCQFNINLKLIILVIEKCIQQCKFSNI